MPHKAAVKYHCQLTQNCPHNANLYLFFQFTRMWCETWVWYGWKNAIFFAFSVCNFHQIILQHASKRFLFGANKLHKPASIFKNGLSWNFQDLFLKLSFSPCFFCLSVSHLCLSLSMSSSVYMCFYEPFFIYLCLTLYLFLYVWLYLSIFLFLSLSLSGSALSKSWIIKLCIGIYIPSSPPPHKWNIPVYHTLSRLYCMVFVITI